MGTKTHLRLKPSSKFSMVVVSSVPAATINSFLCEKMESTTEPKSHRQGIQGLDKHSTQAKRSHGLFFKNSHVRCRQAKRVICCNRKQAVSTIFLHIKRASLLGASRKRAPNKTGTKKLDNFDNFKSVHSSEEMPICGNVFSFLLFCFSHLGENESVLSIFVGQNPSWNKNCHVSGYFSPHRRINFDE